MEAGAERASVPEEAGMTEEVIQKVRIHFNPDDVTSDCIHKAWMFYVLYFL